MENNYGLLIASIVGIVAIVGLVILFSGQGAQGALVQDICGAGMQYKLVQINGGQFGKVCVPMVAVATLDDFGRSAGNAGRPSDATSETQRSFTNWCKTFPDVCCVEYPARCSEFLA